MDIRKIEYNLHTTPKMYMYKFFKGDKVWESSGYTSEKLLNDILKSRGLVLRSIENEPDKRLYMSNNEYRIGEQ